MISPTSVMRTLGQHGLQAAPHGHASSLHWVMPCSWHEVAVLGLCATEVGWCYKIGAFAILRLKTLSLTISWHPSGASLPAHPVSK